MTVGIVWGIFGLLLFLGAVATGDLALGILACTLLFFFPGLAFFAWGYSRNSQIKGIQPAIATGPKLPMWQIAWYAIQLPFAQVSKMLHLSVVPLGISTALGVFVFVLLHQTPGSVPLVPSTGSSQPAPSQGFLFFGLLFFYLVLLAKLWLETPFQVGWMRSIVLGRFVPRGRDYFKFTAIEKHYLQTVSMLSLVLVPLGASLVWFGTAKSADPKSTAAEVTAIVFLVLSVAVGVVAVRLALVIPAAAAGRFQNLRVSWEQTKGMGWRMCGLIVLVFVPFVMAIEILTGILPSVDSFFLRFAIVTLLVFMDFACRAALLGALAVTYRDWVVQPREVRTAA